MKPVTMKKRKPIKRLGKVGKRKAEESACAKELYFQRHGDGWTAPCQLCGGPMSVDSGCDIHHKFRRHKNLNDPTFLLALHRWCHQQVHRLRELENFLASEECDGVGCSQGGVVDLPRAVTFEVTEQFAKDFKL